MIDPFSVLGHVFATALSPAIVELIKRYNVPKGLSPALNTGVAMVLYAGAWGISVAAGTATVEDLPSYLMIALTVAGLSTGAVSLAELRRPRK